MSTLWVILSQYTLPMYGMLNSIGYVAWIMYTCDKTALGSFRFAMSMRRCATGFDSVHLILVDWYVYLLRIIWMYLYVWRWTNLNICRTASTRYRTPLAICKTRVHWVRSANFTVLVHTRTTHHRCMATHCKMDPIIRMGNSGECALYCFDKFCQSSLENGFLYWFDLKLY